MDQTFLSNVRKDLGEIQKVTARPETQNPLLLLILQQAQALAEVRQWAAGVAQQWDASTTPPANLSDLIDGEVIETRPSNGSGEVVDIPKANKVRA